MAYIAMAYIVKAYIVMAYIVMALGRQENCTAACINAKRSPVPPCTPAVQDGICGNPASKEGMTIRHAITTYIGHDCIITNMFLQLIPYCH